MNSEFVRSWLCNCQIQDEGSWISGKEVYKYKAISQLNHKIVYTSRILKTLGYFDSHTDEKARGVQFLLDSHSDNPLYRLPLKIISYVAVGKNELAYDLTNELLTLIGRKGFINFESRAEAPLFDPCFTLETILEVGRFDQAFLNHPKTSELIKLVALSLEHSDNHSFWLWKASLLCKASEFNLLEPVITRNSQESINKLCSGIIFNNPVSDFAAKKPGRPTCTPNLYSKEVGLSHQLLSIVQLYNKKWIDDPRCAELMAQDILSLLFKQLGVSCFESTTITATGKSKRVSDTYVNAVILECIHQCHSSQIVNNQPIKETLNKFCNNHIDNSLRIENSELNVLKVNLSNIPNELSGLAGISDQVQQLHKKIDSMLNNTSDTKLEFIIGFPEIVSSWTGIKARIKYARPIDKKTAPGPNKWINKIDQILDKKRELR